MVRGSEVLLSKSVRLLSASIKSTLTLGYIFCPRRRGLSSCHQRHDTDDVKASGARSSTAQATGIEGDASRWHFALPAPLVVLALKPFTLLRWKLLEALVVLTDACAFVG